MLPAGSPPPGHQLYFWPRNAPASWIFSARIAGDPVATYRFERRLTKIPVDRQPVALRSEGFAGELFTPRAPGRHPAILAIGGSGGGMSSTLEAAWLAGQGFPTLSIAYFDFPGLPATLSRIPLEYFAHALAWLSRQPGVDPSQIFVLGASRGSEAALLLGVHYPHSCTA